LASEYGWSKTDILERVYPDEVFEFQEAIMERHRANYFMLLAISHNPHVEEPQALWDELRPAGLGYLDTELDREAMTDLKALLGTSPNIAVKSKA
jgi:hypothetical protein